MAVTELTGAALADALAKINPGGTYASQQQILNTGKDTYNPVTGVYDPGTAVAPAVVTATRKRLRTVATQVNSVPTTPTTPQLTGADLATALAKISPTGASANTILSAVTPKPILSAATPADTITNINQTKDTSLPDVTTGIGNVADAAASVTGLSARIDQIMAANKDALAAKQKANELQATQESGKTGLFDFLKNAPSIAENRANAFSSIGVDPAQYFADQKAGIAEIGKLTEDYNATLAARDQQIAATQDKLASMNFINNQAAQINRNAAPLLAMKSANINAKTAVLQAQQGNFAEATKFVNQAVDDATADQKAKVDSFKLFYQMNQDEIDRLDSTYKDALKTATDQAHLEYDLAVTEKKAVGSLMLDNPNAGIDIANDTLAEAQQKVVDSGGSLAARREARLANGSNTPAGSTSNFTDIMQQAIDAGATPAEAAREAATASENSGIPVDQKTLNSWTDIAGGLKPTATSTAGTTETPVAGEATISQGGTAIGNAFRSTIDGIYNFLFK